MTGLIVVSSSVRVEVLGASEAAVFTPEWQDLAARALEPNVFNDPAVALAAAQHIGGNPQFVFVWEGDEGKARRLLLAVCPLQRPRRLVPGGIVRAWTHKQAALATPLLDRERAGQALEGVLLGCRRAAPRAAAILFPMTMLDGPLAALLQRDGGAQQRTAIVLDEHRRAVLSHGADPQRFLTEAVTTRRLKKLQKARKRLEEKAEVVSAIATTPDAVRSATERFLRLEAKGWKGKRGTALLCTPRLAAFTRTLTRRLATEGKCAVHSLDHGGTPIAMTIVLTSRDRAFIWKVAYDEDFAAYSPGVLLTLDLTQALLADPLVELANSCAVADHPMIDHIWPQRARIGDFLVSAEPGDTGQFARAAQRERLRRQLRQGLKTMLLRLRRRFRPAA